MTEESQRQGPWKCFHCDELFEDTQSAADHFGPYTHSKPACQYVERELRDLEERLRLYREDDTELHREIRALQSSRGKDIRRAEEQGYARGLRDAHLLETQS
jgi:hypothetical protein